MDARIETCFYLSPLFSLIKRQVSVYWNDNVLMRA